MSYYNFLGKCFETQSSATCILPAWVAKMKGLWVSDSFKIVSSSHCYITHVQSDLPLQSIKMSTDSRESPFLGIASNPAGL